MRHIISELRSKIKVVGLDENREKEGTSKSIVLASMVRDNGLPSSVYDARVV